METLQDGGVIGETELQQFTADIVNADSLAVPQLAHCLLHFLHRGLGRKRGVFGQLLDASRIEASSVGNFAFRSSWNHSFHRRIDGLSRNNAPDAFLM